MNKEKYYQTKWEAYKIIGQYQDRIEGVLIDEDTLEKLTLFLSSIPRWEVDHGHTGNHKKNRL